MHTRDAHNIYCFRVKIVFQLAIINRLLFLNTIYSTRKRIFLRSDLPTEEKTLNALHCYYDVLHITLTWNEKSAVI